MSSRLALAELKSNVIGMMALNAQYLGLWLLVHIGFCAKRSFTVFEADFVIQGAGRGAIAKLLAWIAYSSNNFVIIRHHWSRVICIYIELTVYSIAISYN